MGHGTRLGGGFQVSIDREIIGRLPAAIKFGQSGQAQGRQGLGRDGRFEHRPGQRRRKEVQGLGAFKLGWEKFHPGPQATPGSPRGDKLSFWGLKEVH